MLYMYNNTLNFSVEAVAPSSTKDSLQPDTGDDMDIANMEDSVPPTLLEDEDTIGDNISKPDVHANVKLPSRLRKCFFHCL